MVGDMDVLAWQQQWLAGDATAGFNLGVYFNLQGYLEDAIPYYVSSAEHGKHEAMAYLAWVYKMRGELNQAEEWGRRAVDAGNPYAAEMLATLRPTMDLNTAGIVRRAAKTAAVGAAELGHDDDAERNLGIAADLGDVESMLALGYMAENATEYGHAILYFERTERTGVAGSPQRIAATTALASLFEKLGRRDEDRERFKDAVRWYKQALLRDANPDVAERLVQTRHRL